MEEQKNMLEDWKPRTVLGKLVKSGKITHINQITDKGQVILESEISEMLIPNLESDFLMIGQSKGKFGGGRRKIFKQTQKKTCEGNQISFAAQAIVGNRDGYIGLGEGNAKETVPAREKALRQAKIHIVKIIRGCGSWQCNCATPHSIPFEVTAKCGSNEITLIPAPKGTGLVVQRECQKILRLAGIKDIWSTTKGQTRMTVNLARACMDALQNAVKMKCSTDNKKMLGYCEGSTNDRTDN